MGTVRYYSEEFLLWLRYDFFFWTGLSLFTIFLLFMLVGKIVIDIAFFAILISSLIKSDTSTLIVTSILFLFWLNISNYKEIVVTLKGVYELVKN